MEHLSQKTLFSCGKHRIAGRKALFCGPGSDVLLRGGYLKIEKALTFVILNEVKNLVIRRLYTEILHFVQDDICFFFFGQPRRNAAAHRVYLHRDVPVGSGKMAA